MIFIKHLFPLCTSTYHNIQIFIYVHLYLFIYRIDFILRPCRCLRVVFYGDDDRMIDERGRKGEDLEEVGIAFLILFVYYDTLLNE